MSTTISKLNHEQKEQINRLTNSFINLPPEYRLIAFHLIKNIKQLLPYIKQLDKTDEYAYCENIRRIVLSHKAGIEIEPQRVTL